MASEKSEATQRQIAKIISAVFQPTICILLGIILLYLKFIPKTVEDTAKWLITTIGPLAICVTVLKILIRFKVISNWDITKREQRPAFFLFLLSVVSLVLILARLLGFRQVINIMLYPAITFTFATVITFSWKISQHTLFATTAVLIALYLFPTFWLLPILLLPIAVAWSRIKLGRHTTSQAIGGIVLAASMFILWEIYIFSTTGRITN